MFVTTISIQKHAMLKGQGLGPGTCLSTIYVSQIEILLSNSASAENSTLV
jgi:hypothetical protein